MLKIKEYDDMKAEHWTSVMKNCTLTVTRTGKTDHLRFREYDLDV